MTPFPELLHAFFHDWLVQQRNVSRHTVLSYRDSWRLFLRFVAARKTTSVAKLGLDDLAALDVLAFLQHLEEDRKSSIGTRNCRSGRSTASFGLSPTASRWRRRSAQPFCGFPPNRHPDLNALIWTRRRSVRSSPSRISRGLKGSVITSCWRCCTTRALAFRKP